MEISFEVNNMIYFMLSTKHLNKIISKSTSFMSDTVWIPYLKDGHLDLKDGHLDLTDGHPT